jgi:hypothetical protein
MSRKQHVVDLSDEERRTLEWFVSTGERKAEDNTRARILLKADDGLTDYGGLSKPHCRQTSSLWSSRAIGRGP